jgi:hypothetical protein
LLAGTELLVVLQRRMTPFELGYMPMPIPSVSFPLWPTTPMVPEKVGGDVVLTVSEALLTCQR